MYLDAHNLYVWAMSQPLPHKEFQWFEGFTEEMAKTYESSDEYGYFVECDLKYPTELHDAHNDYPLGPTRECVKADALSPYCTKLYKEVYDATKVPDEKVEQLLLTLKDKEKYTVHVQLLKFYLEQGLVLEKVHRVVRFKQSAWLEPYVRFNTDKRKQSTSDFQKDFFKLMNNAPYGKTMEDVKGHTKYELVTRVKRFERLVADPCYKAHHVVNEDLVGVQRAKDKVYLGKPMSVGVAVLDLSKLHMYSFYYNVLKQRYGKDCRLLYTDTDSLVVDVTTDDVYADFREEGMKQHFDFSEYPKDHPNYDPTNAKVLGKFKCETNGVPMSEWVALKAKMYAFKVGDKEKVTGKGVPKHTLKKYTKLDVYRRVLESSERTVVNFTTLRSQNHQMYTVNLTKVGLSSYDNKRYYLDAVNSLAYGHVRCKA